MLQKKSVGFLAADLQVFLKDFRPNFTAYSLLDEKAFLILYFLYC